MRLTKFEVVIVQKMRKKIEFSKLILLRTFIDFPQSTQLFNRHTIKTIKSNSFTVTELPPELQCKRPIKNDLL
jgi:hypothetical protein